MSEAGPIEAPAPPRDEEAALLLLIESLRSAGAQRLDPVRLRYVELLSQRMQAAPGMVRRILQGKLQQALTEFAERLRQAQKAGDDPDARDDQDGHNGHNGLRRPGAQAAVHAPSAPLAQLNRYIQTATQAATQAATVGRLGGDAPARPELRSVRRFSEAWARICAEDQVDQAVGRGPENAGPLNSHGLVLRTLALMRSLSPDYLRRFLSHADSLLWLDQANRKHGQTKTKPARQSRQK